MVPVPGIGTGVLEEDRNLATWIDLKILGSHAYHHTVPGGYTTHYAYILTMLPFTGLAKHLQPFIPASVVWNSGYVMIVWMMCWFLCRNKLFWRV